jgi:hypothetical protein
MGLRELGVHERRDDVVGELRPHQRVHGAGRGLLGPGHRLRAEHALGEAERRPDRDRRRDQREHREERHLGRVAGRAMPLGGAGQLDQERPRPVLGQRLLPPARD